MPFLQTHHLRLCMERNDYWPGSLYQSLSIQIFPHRNSLVSAIQGSFSEESIIIPVHSLLCFMLWASWVQASTHFKWVMFSYFFGVLLSQELSSYLSISASPWWPALCLLWWQIQLHEHLAADWILLCFLSKCAMATFFFIRRSIT